MKKFLLFFLLISNVVFSQGSYGEWEQKFEQLGTMLPTPNSYRTASGAPGVDYWQQKADYKIDVTINDENQTLYGEEEITYLNNSPDVLRYLWVQLDQNVRSNESNTPLVTPSKMSKTYSGKRLQGLTNSYTNIKGEKYNGGFKIAYVKDMNGNDINHSVISTMMRIDLPVPLNHGEKMMFTIDWWYNINDRMEIGGRSGFEHFEENDNYLYTIAQFYPRLAVYSDNEGWQNKQFLGSGEFTLCFGNYRVAITVPSDHIVASTGELQNAKSVLTSEQRKRFELAKKTYDQPIMIVTEEEAREAEKTKEKGLKTWVFSAKNVRDFGWASSRKFIWDAMAVKVGKYKPRYEFLP